MKHEVLENKEDTLRLKICREINEQIEKGYIKSVLSELRINRKIIDFKWDRNIKIEREAILEIVFE